ncbi:MAG: hypothetical protein IKO12_09110 [Bacteroidaceae bacterium]|nr:hypothetical protein [Bacteroidaceae bacterium]
MKKYISLMAFCLLAVFSQVLVSCSDDGVDEKSNANGYNVDLPNGATSVTYEPLSDEEISELKLQGYDIVGTPVKVTQDGNAHVELDDYATVSFNIPSDFPKEAYKELVGVLISDDGVEYIIPEYSALKQGIVKFETRHFCTAAAAKDRERLNDKFAEYVAVNGWNSDLREKDFNKLSDQLKEAAESVGLGENDLLGYTMREVLGNNDYVKKTIEYIDAYDEGTLTDDAINDVSEKLATDIKSKMLSILFKKWKEDPNNKKVKECLEKHLSKDNMEKAGTLLGSENPAAVAWQFAKDFAVDKMKDFATQNPYVKAYVKAVQVEAKAINIAAKFFYQKRAEDMYKEFEEEYAHRGSDWEDFWNTLVIKYKIRQFAYGMTDEQMREMFEKRYNDRKIIEAKKAEIKKLIDIWDENYLLDTKQYFGENHDYVQRLTRLHTLMERFRKELVVGKYLKNVSHPNEINRMLAEIVAKYIELYPDEEAFYKWLAKEGYIDKKLQEEVDDLGEKRSWWLIETIINKHENTTRDNGHYVDYMNYTATETEQTMTGMCTGMKSYYEYVQQPVSFVSTIQAPPAKIESGEKIVLHCTVKRTSPEAYCHLEVSPWMTWESEYSQTFLPKTNEVGATGAGTRDIHATSGEWDFELSISSGSKNQKKKLVLGDACRSQIHWVYRWCSIFEKDEP